MDGGKHGERRGDIGGGEGSSNAEEQGNSLWEGVLALSSAREGDPSPWCLSAESHPNISSHRALGYIQHNHQETWFESRRWCPESHDSPKKDPSSTGWYSSAKEPKTLKSWWLYSNLESTDTSDKKEGKEMSKSVQLLILKHVTHQCWERGLRKTATSVLRLTERARERKVGHAAPLFCPVHVNRAGCCMQQKINKI